MNDGNEKNPVIARDVGIEEAYPGEAEETAAEMMDDPYLYEAYQATRDEPPPGPGGASLLELAKAHLPHITEGKRILVAIKPEGVWLKDELEYLFSFRIAYADGRELEVQAVLDAQEQIYRVAEPIESWSSEVYFGSDDPGALTGEDRLRWFACHFVHKLMQRALQSGIFAITAARENLPGRNG